MYEWQQLIQTVVNEMDDAIMRRDDQALTLRALAARLHYSEYHATHKFREIAGMSLRTYLHQRRLAFALKEVRDTAPAFVGHRAGLRLFRAGGLYPRLQGALRRYPRCLPPPAPPRSAPHPHPSLRSLYLWIGRDRYG